MKIYAVLGSAPLGADRISLVECNQRDVMLSFFDYGKSFVSLSSLNQAIKDKYEAQNNISSRRDSRPL